MLATNCLIQRCNLNLHTCSFCAKSFRRGFVSKLMRRKLSLITRRLRRLRSQGDWKINAYKEHQLIPKWGDSKANKARSREGTAFDEWPAVETAFWLFQFSCCGRRTKQQRSHKIQTILMITWIINDLFIIRNQPRRAGQFFLSIFARTIFSFCSAVSIEQEDEKCGEEYSSVFGTLCCRVSFSSTLKGTKLLAKWNPRSVFRRIFFVNRLFFFKKITKKQKSFFSSFCIFVLSRRGSVPLQASQVNPQAKLLSHAY